MVLTSVKNILYNFVPNADIEEDEPVINQLEILAQAIGEDVTDLETVTINHYEKKRIEILHKQVEEIKVTVSTNIRVLQQQLQVVGSLMTRTSNFDMFVQDITEKSSKTSEDISVLSSQFDIRNTSATNFSREITSLALILRKASEEKNKRIQDLIGFQLFLALTFNLMLQTAIEAENLIKEPDYKIVEDMENIIVSLQAAQKNLELVTGQWNSFLPAAKNIYKDIFAKLQI